MGGKSKDSVEGRNWYRREKIGCLLFPERERPSCFFPSVHEVKDVIYIDIEESHERMLSVLSLHRSQTYLLAQPRVLPLFTSFVPDMVGAWLPFAAILLLICC